MAGKNDILRMLTGQKKPAAADPAAPSAPATGAGDSTAPSNQSGGGGGGFFGGLLDNPLFSAGAGIAILGAAATALRSSGKQLLGIAKKQLTTSLEVTSKDHSYQWVLQWISTHAGRRATHLGVETSFTRHESGKVDTTFGFVPGTGRHYIWYGGHVITVNRERDPSVLDLKSGTPWEAVRLSTFGRSRDVFTRLLTEAKDLALQKEEGHTVMYTMGHITMTTEAKWEQFGHPRKRRPLDSVVLASGQKERIVADMREFTSSQKWYVERGIPYRRGYLLHGPPGGGKTSFISALAGEFHYNICLLRLNDRGLTDDKLQILMANAPPRSIILLEDIDAAFVKRDPRMAWNVTFSGLLNTLDGVASAEERIVFMTTNHIDRLDPALIRPGRVDVKEEITHATPHQISELFARFYPNASAEAAAFVAKVGTTQLSMAALQGYFLQFKTSAAAALQHCDELLLARIPQLAIETAEARADAARAQSAFELEINRQIDSNERILAGLPPKPKPATSAAASTKAASTASSTGGAIDVDITSRK